MVLALAREREQVEATREGLGVRARRAAAGAAARVRRDLGVGQLDVRVAQQATRSYSGGARNAPWRSIIASARRAAAPAAHVHVRGSGSRGARGAAARRRSRSAIRAKASRTAAASAARGVAPERERQAPRREEVALVAEERGVEPAREGGDAAGIAQALEPRHQRARVAVERARSAGASARRRSVGERDRADVLEQLDAARGVAAEARAAPAGPRARGSARSGSSGGSGATPARPARPDPRAPRCARRACAARRRSSTRKKRRSPMPAAIGSIFVTATPSCDSTSDRTSDSSSPEPPAPRSSGRDGARTYPSLPPAARRYPARPPSRGGIRSRPRRRGDSALRRAALLATAFWARVLVAPGVAIGCSSRRRVARGRGFPRGSTPRSRAPALRGAQVGAFVSSARDGRQIYAREADRPLVPASNQKILTALAALSAFGPAHRFTTDVRADRPPDRSGAVGTLYVIGGGDPGLTAERWWRLAADLRARGIARVDAARARRRPLRPRVVAPELGRGLEPRVPRAGRVARRGLRRLHGVARAGRVAGRAGRRAHRPARRLVPRSRTARAPGRRGAATASSSSARPAPRGERVVVTGLAARPARGPVPVLRSVSDPVRYAGAVLRAQLEAVGIEVRGETRRGARAGSARSRSTTSRARASPRRSSPFLKWSINVVGETLCKDLALAARRAARKLRGGRRRRSATSSRGSASRSPRTVIVDGSGLSYYEPHDAAHARRGAARRARARSGSGPSSTAGLPILGSDGTLRRRGSGRARPRAREDRAPARGWSRCRATRSRPNGEVRVFSVIVNGHRGGARSAMRALDAFAEALARPRAADGRPDAARLRLAARGLALRLR